MKRRRFSAEQIVAVLKQTKILAPVAELTRQVVISEQTVYRGMKQHIGREVDQLRQLKRPQKENTWYHASSATKEDTDATRTP